jgi:OPT oligopeptide transporter protein
MGLSILGLSLDWSVFANYFPVAMPWWATANYFGGLIIWQWIVTPLCYYFNVSTPDKVMEHTNNRVRL